MKKISNNKLFNSQFGSEVEVYGWLTGRKNHGKLLFIKITDVDSTVQVVVSSDNLSDEVFQSLKNLPVESGLHITCKIELYNGEKELKLIRVTGLYKAEMLIDPRPRSDIDIFDDSLTHQIFKYRHLYLRNPKVSAILKFRSWLMSTTRDWFTKNDFMEFDAPILTPAPLYDGSTAMSINVHDESVYLTQCAGFYLEAAAQSFERVYNMGPSFRGEESRSKRHLMEYWHIKAELLWGNREDIIYLVEDILSYITQRAVNECSGLLEVLGTSICTDALKIPYPRITHEEAIQLLRSKGDTDADFNKGLSSEEEEFLAKHFQSPFWVIGIPRTIEPFPYSIDPDDDRLTVVADLIASNGCGELLGVAEKIFDSAMLNERLAEKNKEGDYRYDFVRDVHSAGCVPHIAFGMGLERLIRWLLQIPHVRDAIPFPRVVRRKIYP
jgi:asparaginyl-tRNA synthetase